MKSTSTCVRFGVGAFLFLGLSGLMAAQEMHASKASSGDRPDWGTKDRILSHIDFTQFLTTSSKISYETSGSGTYGLYNPAGIGTYLAVAHIPSGALLTYAELDYCDSSDIAEVSLLVQDCNFHGNDCEQLAFLDSFDGPQGCSLVTKAVSGYTMDNNARQIVLFASTTGGDETVLLGGVYLGYQLQLSAAPLAPTFGDVPTSHTYYRAIEALASSGITGGCGHGNFCPSQNVTRGEMAAFLARAFGLHFPN